MASPVGQLAHRVLLVDDDAAVRAVMHQGLKRKGFEVVDAASVTEALRRIATESFDLLITDLHMPDPGDGFTVVSAMRHSQPDVLTLLVSGYPDVRSTMADILLQADVIIAKPIGIGQLTKLVTEKMLNRKPTKRLEKERVGVILQRCVTGIVEKWLLRAKQSSELNCLPLSDEERTGHLPKLVEDIAIRLSHSSATAKDSDANRLLSLQEEALAAVAEVRDAKGLPAKSQGRASNSFPKNLYRRSGQSAQAGVPCFVNHSLSTPNLRRE